MKDGGPAFPYIEVEKDFGGEPLSKKQISGMTLLDYFAAKAMQALILKDSEGLSKKTIAHGAYLNADEMLREREKRGEQ